MAAVIGHRKSARDRFLLLDAGNLFTVESKETCQRQGTVEAILKSDQDVAYDAINFSHRDLVLGLSFLLQKAKALDSPFISTSLLSKNERRPLFDPFIIRKMEKIVVAVFGLMDHPPPDQEASKEHVVTNPHDGVSQAVSSLEGKANLIIALSSLSGEANVKLFGCEKRL